VISFAGEQIMLIDELSGANFSQMAVAHKLDSYLLKVLVTCTEPNILDFWIGLI
jgi:hypothetical protein